MINRLPVLVVSRISANEERVRRAIRSIRPRDVSLRRQLAGTAVQVVEVFPPALDTGLATDMIVPGVEQNGPEVIDEVARRSVEGILAGEPMILPHPQSEQLVQAIGDSAEQLADNMNPTLGRKEGWDRE